MFTKVNETITLELRPGYDGFGVDSIVATNWGGDARNQVFWSKSEAEARAFIQGAQMVAALS
jgi:hypothetical protein